MFRLIPTGCPFGMIYIIFLYVIKYNDITLRIIALIILPFSSAKSDIYSGRGELYFYGCGLLAISLSLVSENIGGK